ncbi:gamma-glutamylcyclotransferase [Actinokineospora cianjurensis]|uniref:Gamma-glutamyl AIG2-like cyclotransferase n=1 Tax=Actinokineospora cianjurensis TaxID=585224 RepID=A0A421B3B4_9PSEU|nr:gamma-glutamylcyclotransferase [Actinokineospora cianjurensis]RLK58871.1 gamma-glutamyl AIG2-like cyclotransferase [Actinokineospora cianjurensis]
MIESSRPQGAHAVNRVVDQLLGHQLGHPLLVAVDGVPGAGQAVVARALVAAIEGRGRVAVHLSSDGSPEFVETVVHQPGAPSDAVVVVDGAFLQREPLAEVWDEVVFVDAEQHDPYLDEHPAQRATIVVGAGPVLRRIGGTGSATVQLFSYGTLRLPQVQVAHFGRELDGTPDTLPAHRADWVTITDPAVIADSGTDRHPIVRPSTDPSDSVPGTLLTLTTTDLAAADTYEVPAYHRVPVDLGSGTRAWTYLAVNPATPS